MKRLLLSLSVALFLSVSAFADEPQKFSPEKFQAEMEQFITQEACLTPEESAKFFPLLREMHQKQRAIQCQIKKECKIKPVDEAECKKAVQKRDVYELELKNIQQTYHNKFFTSFSAYCQLRRSMMSSRPKTVSIAAPSRTGARKKIISISPRNRLMFFYQ